MPSSQPPPSSLHSCAADVGGPSSHAGPEKAQEEESLLCVVLCDFLFDTPKVPRKCWDKDICDRAAAAFTRCRPPMQSLTGRNNNEKTIDLRGEYVSSAIPLFLQHLHETSLIASVNPSVRRLNVIAGCLKHGVGKGKLKDGVLARLKEEMGVVDWHLKNKDALICIDLKSLTSSSLEICKLTVHLAM